MSHLKLTFLITSSLWVICFLVLKELTLVLRFDLLVQLGSSQETALCSKVTKFLCHHEAVSSHKCCEIPAYDCDQYKMLFEINSSKCIKGILLTDALLNVLLTWYQQSLLPYFVSIAFIKMCPHEFMQLDQYSK